MASRPPGLTALRFGEGFCWRSSRSGGSQRSLAGLGSPGPTMREERRPRCWESCSECLEPEVGAGLLCLGPKPKRVPLSIPTKPNFLLHQGRGARRSPQGPQDTLGSQKEMSGLLLLTLGPILPRQELLSDLKKLRGGREGSFSGRILSPLSRIFKNCKFHSHIIFSLLQYVCIYPYVCS